MTSTDTTAAPNSTPAERALFTLAKPYKQIRDGAEIDIHGVEMRALLGSDLTLLDQFQGKPIALIQNVVGRLCDLSLEQVQQLDLEDFAMLADDVIWQLNEVCGAMGLPLHLFAHPFPDEQGVDAIMEMVGTHPQNRNVRNAPGYWPGG